jgi:hypothetical protein
MRGGSCFRARSQLEVANLKRSFIVTTKKRKKENIQHKNKRAHAGNDDKGEKKPSEVVTERRARIDKQTNLRKAGNLNLNRRKRRETWKMTLAGRG